MNSTINNPKSTFIFWLFDWATTTVSAGYDRPGYILCEIDSTWLRIFGGPRIAETLIDNIEATKIVRWASVPATLVTVNVVLKLKQQVDTPGRKTYRSNELVIAPMDVYTFRQSLSESKAMIKVIEAFQASATPDVEPNPYLRCRQPRTRVPRESPDGPWDPMVPPYVYSEPTYSPRRLWILLALLLVIVPVLTLVMGLIGNVLLGQP